MFRLPISLITIVLLWIFLPGTGVGAEQELRIAVASDTQEKSGSISMSAGRAPYFLIFDRDGKLLETVANPHADDPGGSGPSTAAFLADKKVGLIVAGRFGPKMATALQSVKIKYFERQGTIVDGVKGVEHAK